MKDAEEIFLNNSRWSSKVIAWKDFLSLLEGQPIHFSAQKKTYAKDFYLEQDMPIFATSKAPFTYVGKYNSVDDRETEMKVERYFHSTTKYSKQSKMSCHHVNTVSVNLFYLERT